MRKGRTLVLAVLALLVASAGFGSPARPDARTQQVSLRPVGMNAEPSMRPWRYVGANPDGWWCRPGGCAGVRSGTAFVDREMPLIAKLGTRTLRLEFPWPLIEPRRGRYDWRRADYILAMARRHGLIVQPILVYTPSWTGRALNAPPAARDFSRFARAFATRYRRSLSHYELWNEPNSHRYFQGNARDYVRRVLIPGSRAVRVGDPGAKVLLGGPTSADVGWLEAIYSEGGGSSFDILPFHDYSGDAAAIVRNAQVVQRILNAHGQGRKPIWLGEFGIQEADLDGPNQATLLRDVVTSTAPLAMVQWYSLRDDFSMECCPPRTLEHEFYGLMSHDYVEKRSYETLRQLLAAQRTR